MSGQGDPPDGRHEALCWPCQAPDCDGAHAAALSVLLRCPGCAHTTVRTVCWPCYRKDLLTVACRHDGVDVTYPVDEALVSVQQVSDPSWPQGDGPFMDDHPPTGGQLPPRDGDGWWRL